MKRLILVFLFIPLSIFALDCSVEAGWQEKELEIYDIVADDFGEYFIEVQIWQDLWIFEVYGIYRNEMHNTESWTMRPVQDYFTIGVEANVGDLQFIAEHECDHPVDNYLQITDGLYGGHTSISLKYSTR